MWNLFQERTCRGSWDRLYLDNYCMGRRIGPVKACVNTVPATPPAAPGMIIVSVRVDPPSVIVEVKGSPLLEVDESVGVLEGRGLELPAGATVVVAKGRVTMLKDGALRTLTYCWMGRRDNWCSGLDILMIRHRVELDIL